MEGKAGLRAAIVTCARELTPHVSPTLEPLPRRVDRWCWKEFLRRSNETQVRAEAEHRIPTASEFRGGRDSTALAANHLSQNELGSKAVKRDLRKSTDFGTVLKGTRFPDKRFTMVVSRGFSEQRTARVFLSLGDVYSSW